MTEFISMALVFLLILGKLETVHINIIKKIVSKFCKSLICNLDLSLRIRRHQTFGFQKELIELDRLYLQSRSKSQKAQGSNILILTRVS